MALDYFEWRGEIEVFFDDFSHVFSEYGIEMVFDFIVGLGVEMLGDFRPLVAIFGMEYEECDFLVLCPLLVARADGLHYIVIRNRMMSFNASVELALLIIIEYVVHSVM